MLITEKNKKLNIDFEKDADADIATMVESAFINGKNEYN